jgi:hypothetical protein
MLAGFDVHELPLSGTVKHGTINQYLINGFLGLPLVREPEHLKKKT